MKLKSNLKKNLALGLTIMVAAGSVVPNVAIAKNNETITTIESIRVNEYEGKELATTIYDKNNKKIIDVKMLIKDGKVVAPYLKGIEIKSVNMSKNGKFAIVLNTDDKAVIEKLLKAIRAFYGKERTMMSSYNMSGDIYETEIVKDSNGNIVSEKENKEEDNQLENLNTDFLNNEDANKIADTLKELIENNKQREAEKFLEDLNLNPLDKEIMDSIMDEFKKMVGENKKSEESKEIYDKIKDKIVGEDEVNNLVSKIQDILEAQKEREFLESLNLESIDKKVSGEMAGLFKEYLDAKKDSIEEYNKIKEKLTDPDLSFTEKLKLTLKEAELRDQISKDLYNKISEKLTEDDYSNLVNLINELNNNVKEREDKNKESDKETEEGKFLENLDLEVLNPDVTSDIKDMFDKMIDDNKKKEESEKIYDNIKDKLNPEDDAVNDLAEKIKEIKQEAEEREFLENLDFGVINPDVSSDVKDMFAEMIKENERIAAEEKAKKESEDLYNKIKDNLTPEDKEIEDLAGKIKDLEYDTRAKKFNNQKGINFELLREKFIAKINAERAAHGVGALVLDPRLQKGTETRAEELASINHIRTGPNNDQKHKRLDGESSFRTAFDYMPDYEYNKAGYLGENLVGTWIEGSENGHYLGEPADQSVFDEEKVAEDLFQKWKKSPGHYENFMSKDYKTMWLEARLGEPKFDPEYNAEFGMLVGVQILSVKSEEDYKKMEETEKLNSVDGEVAEEVESQAIENKEQVDTQSNDMADGETVESIEQNNIENDKNEVLEEDVVFSDNNTEVKNKVDNEALDESNDSEELTETSADTSSANETADEASTDSTESSADNTTSDVDTTASTDSQTTDAQASAQSDVSDNSED